ncbi:MAG: hypothetical protein EA349_10155 [Halomonadaceae bacterium]|nr:MAG: hypothetical protein EA349_10155 [Halomonadaceae bacterium]
MTHNNRPPDPVLPLSLFPLGLFIALLPLVTIHTTYLISASQGFVDWCIPYFQSCTSISATGRNGLGYFVFKGVMIPTLVLLVFFWWINHRWLRVLGYPQGRYLFLLGLMASVFMLLYTLSLGHGGDAFELLRRIGVSGYVGLTGIAQISLGAALYRARPLWLSRRGKRLLSLSGFTLGVAILSLILDALPGVDYGRMNHSFEWILIVLLNIHGVGVVLSWRQGGLVLDVHTAGQGR